MQEHIYSLCKSLHLPKFVMGGFAGAMSELRYQASDTSAMLKTQSLDIAVQCRSDYCVKL
jgi:hypothetical protein